MRAIVWAFGLTVIAVQFSGAEVIGTATVISDEAAIYNGEEIVSRAKKGDRLDITAVKGDWYGVVPEGGWIHKKYVRYQLVSKEPDSSVPQTHAGQLRYVVRSLLPALPRVPFGRGGGRRAG